MEVDSSQVLSAEEDKALWSKVVSESSAQKETMIEAEFAPPPVRYVRGVLINNIQPSACAHVPIELSFCYSTVITGLLLVLPPDSFLRARRWSPDNEGIHDKRSW